MTHRVSAFFGFVLVVAVIGCGGDASRSERDLPAAAEPTASPTASSDDAPLEVTPDADACDGCARARASHAVCRECRTPYLCGIAVRSADLHEMVDVPGHRFDAAGLECSRCREAVADEGWCEVHGVGFRRGVVHASRLGHLIAFGTSAPDALHSDCATCANAGLDPQWCARCGHGRVGNLRYVERRRFNLVKNEFLRLQRAIAYHDRCELCTLAHFSGMTCPSCRTVHPKVEPLDERR